LARKELPMGVEYFCDLCGKDMEPDDEAWSGPIELTIHTASQRTGHDCECLLKCHVCNFCRDALLERKDKMLRLMSIMAGGGCDGKPSFDV